MASKKNRPPRIQVNIMGKIEVGKELVANASQRGSWRHDGFCVKVNCGFIQYTLIDSKHLGMKRGLLEARSASEKASLNSPDAY